MRNGWLFVVLSLLPIGSLPGAADGARPVIFRASYDGSLVGVDSKGQVQPLEVTGTVEYRPGKYGQALLCGGDAAQVKYPVDGHLRASQGTVSLWAQALDWPEGEQAFHVLFETAGPGWLVLYKFFTGGWLFLSGTDHGHYGSAWHEQYAVRNGEWHHYAGVWSKDRLSLYIDGRLAKESPLPALPTELQGWFRIGDDGWTKPHSSRTLVDEVRIYRHALSAAQVAAVAQGQEVDYRLPLTLTVEPYPSRQEWRVTVDASGYSEDPQARAQFAIASGGTTWASGASGVLRDGVGSAVLDVSRVPAGEQTTTAAVVTGAGAEIARGELAFAKPEAAAWAGNPIGMEDAVPAPFTAMTLNGRPPGEIKAADSVIGCWGRTYHLSGLLPDQVESQGARLLAEPAELTAQTATGPIAWRAGSSQVTAFSDTCVAQTATADSPQTALSSQTTVEVDGMLWTELTLTPRAPTELSQLTLRVPLDRAHATYIHHIRPSWTEDDAGTLPPGGYRALGFHPYVWVGDDDRGLAWFAESAKGWTVVPERPTIEVSQMGTTVLLQVHFIQGPTTLNQPLRLAFGLQATPVKPRPPDARSWRLGNLGTADTLKEPSRGTLQVLWPNGNLQYYGWPEPKDPAAFRQTVAELHAKGERAIPYINLNFMANGAKEWAYYSAEFRDPARSFTTGDVAEMGSALIGACPSSAAWRDLIAWKLAQFVEAYQVDGIYVDCWHPSACLMGNHGCGWRDAAGELQGTFPIRASREIVRRVRKLLQERVPNPHLIIHMSASICIPMLAFADSMLDGEQYQAPTKDPKGDYLAIVPLDTWRAKNTGLQWGVVPFFLPEFTGASRAATLPTHRLMGLMLAHDCSPWPIWCNRQVIFDVWEAADRFGIQPARFLPYWKPNGVTADSPDTVVSAYQQPGKALLVVLNTGGDDRPATLRVDPAALGLRARFTATTAPEGQALPTPDQSFTVHVPARDFRLVVVE